MAFKFPIALIYVAILSLFVQSSAQQRPIVSPNTAFPSYMNELYIGMSIREFSDIRKTIQIPTQKKNSELLLSEMFGEEMFFSSVDYVFQNEKLTAIYIENAKKNAAEFTKVEQFVIESVNRYGKPNYIGLSRTRVLGEGEVKSPLLVWRRDTLSLVVRITPLTNKERNNLYLVSFLYGKDSWVDTKYLLGNLVSMDKREEDGIIRTLLEIIDKRTSNQGNPVQILRGPFLQDDSLDSKKSPIVKFYDYSPVWSSSSIFFLSTRDVRKSVNLKPKMLAEAISKGPSALFKIAEVKDSKMEAFFVTSSLSRPLAFSIASNRLAFTHTDTIYIFDRTKSFLGKVNNGLRVFRENPAWDITGTSIVMSGTHSPSDRTDKNYQYDEDIFVSQISEQLSYQSTELNRCIVRMPGADILPIFTSDNRWVVFAHQGDQPNGNWNIYRVKPDYDVRDSRYSAPELVAENIPKPESLSAFPDGKRILISYAGNEYELKFPPEIIEIDTKNRIFLKLPALLDPNLPLGKPLVPREITISPDGNQIAFSALRWSGDLKDEGSILIYTSNLDGSNIKQVTTNQNIFLEPHRYSIEEVTGLDAWEKLQPSPNLGVVIFP